MKNLLVFTIIAVFLCACKTEKEKNQENNSGSGQKQADPEINFREYEHDFGTIVAGEKVAYVFSFSNIGQGDLVIASASASCGCTVPKYDAKPIPPGKDGSLEVVFNTSGRSGRQTKTVSVRSNARTPVVTLKISAEVLNSINN